MAVTNVQGTLVNFKYREIGDTDWITVVCTEDSQFQITNEVSTRRTNCGIVKSVSDPDFNASGNAVQNATPTTLEASYQAVKALQMSKTKVQFSWISAADVAAGLTEGQGVSNYGLGYFTDSTATASAEADGVMTFSWTFEGTGNLDSFDTSGS
jgi:hypothetical protein